MEYTLKQWRAIRGLSQTELAESIGKTQITVSNWETGKTAPTVLQMQKMCQIYKMPFDFVYVPEVSK